jgi:hypothetical protein
MQAVIMDYRDSLSFFGKEKTADIRSAVLYHHSPTRYRDKAIALSFQSAPSRLNPCLKVIRLFIVKECKDCARPDYRDNFRI